MQKHSLKPKYYFLHKLDKSLLCLHYSLEIYFTQDLFPIQCSVNSLALGSNQNYTE